MNYTEGKWKATGGAVVTNMPMWRPGYTWETIESEQAFYGGCIVAESCMSDDAVLIAQSKNLLNVLELLLTNIEDNLWGERDVDSIIPYKNYVEAKKVFLAARPDWKFANIHYIIHEIKKPVPLRICQRSQVNYLHVVVEHLDMDHLLNYVFDKVNGVPVLIVSEKK